MLNYIASSIKSLDIQFVKCNTECYFVTNGQGQDHEKADIDLTKCLVKIHGRLKVPKIWEFDNGVL